MEKLLLRLARQLDAIDEASLMSLWSKYATQTSRFEPTKRWEEAALVFSLIQAKRWKNQLFNYHWARQSQAPDADLPGAAPLLPDFDLQQPETPPPSHCRVLAFRPAREDADATGNPGVNPDVDPAPEDSDPTQKPRPCRSCCRATAATARQTSARPQPPSTRSATAQTAAFAPRTGPLRVPQRVALGPPGPHTTAAGMWSAALFGHLTCPCIRDRYPQRLCVPFPGRRATTRTWTRFLLSAALARPFRQGESWRIRSSSALSGATRARAK